jgi:hypothetical protein
MIDRKARVERVAARGWTPAKDTLNCFGNIIRQERRSWTIDRNPPPVRSLVLYGQRDYLPNKFAITSREVN